MVGVGYLVDGVDCHAVVSFFVGGDEEDAVVGVEGFPVEEGGDGSHCCCSLSAFNNDWGVSLVGLVAWGVGEVFPQPPLCLELYHIFVMNAPYGVCFRSLFYVGVEALFLRWRGVVLVVLFPFVFGGFPYDLRCFFYAPWV